VVVKYYIITKLETVLKSYSCYPFIINLAFRKIQKMSLLPVLNFTD